MTAPIFQITQPHAPQTAYVGSLFAGGRTTIGEGGHQTGIRKHQINGKIQVVEQGLVGDEIVDRRYHGGPEKAVNFFPVEHYSLLKTHYPEAASEFIAGSFGENISSHGLSDDIVQIGDTYQIGHVILQISQPRKPCWKLNARFDTNGLSAFVEQQRKTGWYARVLQAGTMEASNKIILIDQTTDACSIAEFWDIILSSSPDPDQLDYLSRISTLAADWQKRLAARAAWLRANTATKTPKS